MDKNKLIQKVLETYRKDGIINNFNKHIKKINRISNEWYKNYVLRKYVLSKHQVNNNCRQLMYVSPHAINSYQLSSRQTYTDSRESDIDIPLHKLEKGRFDPRLYTGVILGGNWDQYTKSISFDRVYSGLHDHYVNDKKWEETEYWCQLSLREKVREDKGYARRYLNKTNMLYQSIDSEGFKNIYDLGLKDERKPISHYPFGITVNVGRNGELIFNNTAHHRLSISKILNIDKIPVHIVVLHEKWEYSQKDSIQQYVEKKSISNNPNSDNNI